MTGTIIDFPYDAILKKYASDIKGENGIKYLNGELALPGDVLDEVEGH